MKIGDKFKITKEIKYLVSLDDIKRVIDFCHVN